jgi:hypothetical protein
MPVFYRKSNFQLSFLNIKNGIYNNYFDHEGEKEKKRLLEEK